jgi:hypothetical protein
MIFSLCLFSICFWPEVIILIWIFICYGFYTTGYYLKIESVLKTKSDTEAQLRSIKHIEIFPNSASGPLFEIISDEKVNEYNRSLGEIELDNDGTILNFSELLDLNFVDSDGLPLSQTHPPSLSDIRWIECGEKWKYKSIFSGRKWTLDYESGEKLTQVREFNDWIRNSKSYTNPAVYLKAHPLFMMSFFLLLLMGILLLMLKVIVWK